MQGHGAIANEVAKGFSKSKLKTCSKKNFREIYLSSNVFPKAVWVRDYPHHEGHEYRKKHVLVPEDGFVGAIPFPEERDSTMDEDEQGPEDSA